MKHILALVILSVVTTVSGCGTFPLGMTYAPADTTRQQHQLDVLTCQDQAKVAVNTAARQTGNHLLSMTIVGIPLAFELEKAKQREVFAQCMTARGYTVVPVESEQNVAQNEAPATDYRYRQ